MTLTAPLRRAEPDIAVERASGERPWWTAPGVLASAVVLVLVAVAALAPHLLTSQDPLFARPTIRLRPPSAAHWFGTDEVGRDLYTRVVFGARTTIAATVLATVIGLVGGSAIGLLAGFAGGRVDTVCMRAVDVLLAIPGLLLAMTVIAALGFGTVNVAIAVGVASIASFARVMRTQVLRVRAETYVEAAAAGGERGWSVAVRHVLPNAAGPVAALTTLELGSAVLAVAALSFLGYGVVPPAPEWGSLISQGRNHLATAWWLTTLPGLVVVAVVLAANYLGRAAERHLTRSR